MKNNLGITNNEKIEKIEYYLFNIKYHLIDYSFTFNEDNLFSIQYLEKLHFFLFGDIYSKEICEIRNKELINEADNILNKIKDAVLYNDVEELCNQIFKLWELQLFPDGNTRTILCLLKVASKYYDFNISYDFNKDVTENYFINAVIDSINVKTKTK